MTIDPEDALAVAVVHAIHSGDVATLRTLLSENPGLAAASLGDDDLDGMSRTLLHVATDWPGHFPNGAETVGVLAEAGADVNGRFRGPQRIQCGARRGTQRADEERDCGTDVHRLPRLGW